MRTACALVAVLLPVALGAQAPRRSCPAVDSLLGEPTGAQRNALVFDSRWPSGEIMVRTGTRRASNSGLAITSLRAPGAPLASTTIQLELLIPFADALDGLQAEDTVAIVADDTLRLTLGTATPPRIEGDRDPMRLPLSVRILPEDLLVMARARALTARFGTREVRFDRTDLASANALYRILACSAGQ